MHDASADANAHVREIQHAQKRAFVHKPRTSNSTKIKVPKGER